VPRPRTKRTGLPSYCYRDRRGKLFMLHPAGLDDRGRVKLRRVTYATLDALLAAWRSTWGEAPRKGASTVGHLLDAYVAHLLARERAGDVSATTARDYERCVLSLRPVWEAVRIEDVDTPAVDRWHEARGARSRTRANRERTVLQNAFALGMRKGMATENPVRFVPAFKERPRTRYVTDAEFMAVYAHAAPVVRAAMLLAAVTGLRQGDLLRLRRADFSEAGLTVQTRKTGQPMEFAWSEGLRRAVMEAVESRQFVPLILLSTERGAGYTSDGFRTMWQRAMTAALADGLASRFTFNDLRAKAGSESRDWRLLGHMDQRTFERVYNRLPRKVQPSR
jgi:integrase